MISEKNQKILKPIKRLIENDTISLCKEVLGHFARKILPKTKAKTRNIANGVNSAQKSPKNDPL